MKRLVIIAGLLVSLSAAAQVPLEVPEVSVFLERQGRGRAQQGMLIGGKYIFSFEDGGHVNVYDFNRAFPLPVGSFDLASSHKDNHANNAEFGVEKAKGGSFPVIYITNGKVGSAIEWTCFVESVTEKKGHWSSKLVQKIILDGTDGWEEAGYTKIFGAPSWLIDQKEKALWVFSAIKRTTPQVTKDFSENIYVATRFRLPKLSEGEEIHLNVNDIQAQKLFTYDIGFTQGGCVRDGIIWYCYGVGNRSEDRPAALRAYDTRTGEIVLRYDLKDVVPQEPEDIVLKGNWIYLNCNTPSKGKIKPNIYRMELPKRFR